jgi:tripartite-type tricarboxylate transporter receptor subunit TctC
MVKNRRAVLQALAALVFAGAFANATAQGYPSRPIRIIVNSPAGGGNDFVARTVAQKMEESMKQPVVVENRAGGSGIVASDYVAKSAPDGYTVLLVGPGLLQTAALYDKLPYDPLRDFTPVTDLIKTPLWLAVNTANVPSKSVTEFVDFAKAHPGKVSYGSMGSGSTHHVYAFKLGDVTGLDMIHVPYKGAAPAMMGLAGGEISALFLDLQSLKPHVAAGKVRLLAATGTQRPTLTPEIPTFAELGFQGFEAYGWNAVFVPSKTPPEVVARLNAEVNRALKHPDVIAKFTGVGFQMAGSTQEQFAAQVKTDYVHWTTLIKKTGVKLD